MPTLRLWLPLCCRHRRLQSNGKVYASNGGSKDRSDASETALASKTEACCRICPFWHRLDANNYDNSRVSTRASSGASSQSQRMPIASKNADTNGRNVRSAAALTVACFRTTLSCVLSSLTRPVIKWTLENAWLLLLVGVFNMSFSIRASGRVA